MNIWILTSELPHSLCGGVARYAHNFACSLAQMGVKVRMVGPGDKEQDEQLSSGYRLTTFVSKKQFLSEWKPSDPPDGQKCWPHNILCPELALSYEMADFIGALVSRDGPPDIVECQDHLALSIFLQLRKRSQRDFLANVPVVVNLQRPEFIVREFNQEPRFKLPTYWIGEQEKAAIKGADGLVAPSYFVSRAVRMSMREPDLPVVVIPPPHAPEQPLYKGPINEKEVLCLGRLEPSKGLIQLIKACGRMWEQGVDFHLRLVGASTTFHPTGEPFDEYLKRKFALYLESGRLRIEPAVPHEQTGRLLGQAGIVVFPSLWDNFSNTCLEAMMCARPILASRSGGQADLIGEEGVTGYLFDWDWENDFADKLQRLLVLSPTQRQRLGDAGQARARGLCHPQQIAIRRVEHFKEVIRRTRPGHIYPFFRQAIPALEGRQRLPRSMGQRDLVSVVVPCFNLGAYIEESVDSVFASAGNFRVEVVIIDDGSTDPATLAVLEKLKKRGDSRVRIESRPNRGLAETRNLGARLAQGEFLVFLDADDLVEPAFFMRAIEVLQRYENVHVVTAWARFFGDDNGIWPAWNWQLPYLLAHNSMIPICLIRRSAFLRFGFNKEEMYYGLEDWESWISMAEAGCGAVAIPEPLVRYRVRSQSMFREIRRSQHLYLYDRVVENHPELYRAFGDELFQMLNANGPAYEWDNPACWVSPYDALQEKSESNFKK